VVRDFSLHRGRHPQRPMDAAEIVVREVQRQRRVQVIPLLRVGVRQAREPLAHCRSEPFFRSTCDVLARSRSGTPLTASFATDTDRAGLYRSRPSSPWCENSFTICAWLARSNNPRSIAFSQGANASVLTSNSRSADVTIEEDQRGAWLLDRGADADRIEWFLLGVSARQQHVPRQAGQKLRDRPPFRGTKSPLQL
jgi:hypothetical protein